MKKQAFVDVCLLIRVSERTGMEKFKVILSIFAGAIAAMAKQYVLIVLFTAIAVVFDFITGIVKAKITGEGLNSQKATKGFWKKVALFVALFFGFFLDYFIPYGAGYLGLEMKSRALFGMIFGCYIVINECISIAENLYAANPEILPKWLIKLLTQAKDNLNKENIINKEEKQNE